MSGVWKKPKFSKKFCFWNIGIGLRLYFYWKLWSLQRTLRPCLVRKLEWNGIRTWILEGWIWNLNPESSCLVKSGMELESSLCCLMSRDGMESRLFFILKFFSKIYIFWIFFQNLFLKIFFGIFLKNYFFGNFFQKNYGKKKKIQKKFFKKNFRERKFWKKKFGKKFSRKKNLEKKFLEKKNLEKQFEKKFFKKSQHNKFFLS